MPDSPSHPSPPRVTWLVNAFENDAPTRLMAEVARAWTADTGTGGRFIALSRGGPLRNQLMAEGFDTAVAGMGGVADAGGLMRLWSLLRRDPPDLLHATLLRPVALGVPVARLAGVPCVVATCNGLHEWHEGGRVGNALAGPLYRRASRRVDVMVAVSAAVGSALVRNGVRAPATKVIHNGVDTALFTPDARSGRRRVLDELWGSDCPDDVVLVGAAGNLRHVKGYDVFIRAAAAVAREDERVRFVLWGDGPERGHLAQLAAVHQLRGRLAMPGRRCAMPEALAACDVFVQPSRREGFGLAAAEAMSCGVPVVASHVDGLPEVVGDGTTGYLVTPCDDRALARGLARLVSHPDLRASMAAAARARACAHFTLARMTRAYMDTYMSLSARRGRP